MKGVTDHDRLAQLLDSDDPPLDLCLLVVSEALSGNPEAVTQGLAALASLAAGVEEPTIDALVHHLFTVGGFVGDTDDYHSAENSFLDAVLVKRSGMPITLAAVTIGVGQRVGLGLHGVGMPGHFLVGLDTDPGVFIDPFAGGVRLDVTAAEARFHRLFGDSSVFDPAMLRPTATPAIVNRVLNNLVRTFADRDPTRLDRLIELRVALPGGADEQQLLIRLAEARGKWDLAARLAESADPDDPSAPTLRSRLN